MSEQIQFETPENIQVSYQLAGPGTRFIAWFVDSILVIFFAIAILFTLACSGIATDQALKTFDDSLRNARDKNELADPNEMRQVPLYFFGVGILVWGLGGFFYFGCSELWLNGQTLGKRFQQIRVVKDGGFSLDAGSIFVRNFFRVADNLPPLWIVPVASAKSQRLGDMVAGTLVVLDKPKQMSNIRVVLSQRSAAECKFLFDATKLKRVRPQDIESVAKILERWSGLSGVDKEALLNQVIPALAKRLQTEIPAENDSLLFLEDLLAAEYRRQDRNLG